MNKERKLKELGAKIYEVLLHILSIVGLIMAVDGLDLLREYGISIFGPQKLWWGWLLLVGVAFIRLHILGKIKEEARNRGMLLTELTDELQKEQNGDK